jgi:hypothetical protein
LAKNHAIILVRGEIESGRLDSWWFVCLFVCFQLHFHIEPENKASSASASPGAGHWNRVPHISAMFTSPSGEVLPPFQDKKQLMLWF